jgi:hypothetical protein
MTDIYENQLITYQAQYEYLLEQEAAGNLKNADKKLFAVEEKIRLLKAKTPNQCKIQHLKAEIEFIEWKMFMGKIELEDGRTEKKKIEEEIKELCISNTAQDQPREISSKKAIYYD